MSEFDNHPLTLISQNPDLNLKEIFGVQEDKLQGDDPFILNRFRAIAKMLHQNSPFFIYSGKLPDSPSELCNKYNNKVLSVWYMSALFLGDFGTDRECYFWRHGGGSCSASGVGYCQHIFEPISRAKALELLAQQDWPKIDTNTGHFTYHTIAKLIEEIKSYYGIS